MWIKNLITIIASVPFIFGIPTILLAGQISVINPSSGSEASGVVMISTPVPANIDAGTVGRSPLGDNLDGSLIKNFLDVRINRIEIALNDFNIGLLSETEISTLVSYIDGVLKSEDPLSKVYTVLLEQRKRLANK